ncbi:hypothetical protein FOZ60_013052 [Perkinsus olseni]|uniref:Uncharacterized protein n=2 Tax=Perkinsus olseni TaxID=32597 RepID=A0A7J6P8W2_PEROL|nr:hypothetical protein FOZ60_013052 [Perkinsus olseni]
MRVNPYWLLLALCLPSVPSLPEEEWPTPGVLECNNSSVWRSFKTRFQGNAREGFPVDFDLFNEANAICERWDGREYPPYGFYRQLCYNTPEEDDFCLYGYMAALFIRARHLMASDNTEHREIAQRDLQYIVVMCGKELSLDYLKSSTWGLDIMDVMINLEETQFMTYQEYVRTHPIDPPMGPQEYHPREVSESAALSAAEFKVAVMGTHGSLSREPVDQLQRLLSMVEPSARISARYYGLEDRWCAVDGSLCQGDGAGKRLAALFKEVEKDPWKHTWQSMEGEVAKAYREDPFLCAADLLVCTEPLSGCLMGLKMSEEICGRVTMMVGYFGVALLNLGPPNDINTLWDYFDRYMSSDRVLAAANNPILAEQIYYQTGHRWPTVRPHGLYTEATYTPIRKAVLVWRSILYIYDTFECILAQFLEEAREVPEIEVSEFEFLKEGQTMSYAEASRYKAVVLLPWDHAQMTFYELYSMEIPIFIPSEEWMYRLLYQRGQLSVGEAMYQAVRPGHRPYAVTHGEDDVFARLTLARDVAENLLLKAMEAAKGQDLETSAMYTGLALDLVRDMKYFLSVALNTTAVEDTYSSVGVIRRRLHREKLHHVPPRQARDGELAEFPYTPFQMSTVESYDFTRKRKGIWWLRRHMRLDAMRYWYQYSDFSRFPGLQYFDSIPDLLSKIRDLNAQEVSHMMAEYNRKTLRQTDRFWASVVSRVNLEAHAKGG